MILYNQNDQQITLPGVRVGGALIMGASLTAELNNVNTGKAVFSVPMKDDIGNPGNYVCQPPLFDVPPGSNYRITYSGTVEGYVLELTQGVTVKDRVA